MAKFPLFTDIINESISSLQEFPLPQRDKDPKGSPDHTVARGMGSDAYTMTGPVSSSQSTPPSTQAGMTPPMQKEGEMTSAQKTERERLLKGMKKGDWSRYGRRAGEVRGRTATARAMETEDKLSPEQKKKLDRAVNSLPKETVKKLQDEHGEQWRAAAYGIIGSKMASDTSQAGMPGDEKTESVWAPAEAAWQEGDMATAPVSKKKR